MTAWPDAIELWLARELGEPFDVDRLGGLSGAAVWRARGPFGAVVVKRAGEREAGFYRRVAPWLRDAGVSVVACRWLLDDPPHRWLVLEAVPVALPEERWLADPEVIGALRRLHAMTWNRPPDLPGQYVPAWSSEMTGAALGAFGGDDGLRSMLAQVQAAAQPLFAPRCAISGDPNPANWGVRADGSLALFDWERYGAGAPPLDLAITIPGLGDPAGCTLVAERYLTDAPGVLAVEWTTAQLARQIALAKVWSVVEFAASHGAGDAGTAPVMAWLRNEVPSWLRLVAPFALHKAC